MNANIMIVLVIWLGACVGAIYTMIVLYQRHTVWADSEKPLWRSCIPCEGCGVVMLDGNPIPQEYRSYYKTVSGAAKQFGVLQGPITNIKRCETCKGIGHVWYYKSQAQSTRLPGPGMLDEYGD